METACTVTTSGRQKKARVAWEFQSNITKKLYLNQAETGSVKAVC